MYQCHKHEFILSTTEFNRVFRTASVIPAARNSLVCIENMYGKLTSYDTPNKINAREN